jgi:hypothetical protein
MTRPSTTLTLSIADSPRYDGRRDMCDVLEAVLRRTFLGSQGSYQAFHRFVRRLVTTEATGPGRRSAGLSRGFEVRLDRALRGPGDSPDAVRFVDFSYECVVAASPTLRGRMALVNRRVAAPGALSAPFLKNAEVVLRDPTTDGIPVLCDRPERFPEAGADELGQDGLAVPGRTVQPGDVLVAMTARPPRDDLTPEERLLAAIFAEQADPYRDRSVRLGGRLEGCVLAQHVLASRDFPAAGIRRMPGRHVTTDAQLRFGEIARLTTTVAVDQPVEAGDVLVHQDGSAVVVCGTAAGDGPLRAAGRPRSEPDVLVAPGHPWLAGAERATVRLRLRTTGLAGPAVHSRLSGVYALNNAPLAGVPADGFAQILEPEHFYALLDRGATHLAVELYGPRCDFVAWRAPFAAALRDGKPRLNAVREAIPERTADHPDHVSAQLHEWSALLRVLGVQMVRDGDRLSFRPYSDDAVVAATHGTVSLAEGRNPRTGHALRRGLLCEQVFGPERDWVCRCEKLRGERRAGTVCSECGVEVQSSAVRRTRFGHVALAARVVNPLYVYRPNSLLAEWLGLDVETVRRIVACEVPVVSAGDGLFEVTRDAAAAEDDRCLYGADAVEALLSVRTREGKINGDWSAVIRAQLPVLPPALRTMVRMRNGRLLVSDLHDLYLSVVRVNAALRRLLDEGNCPDVLRLKLTAELQQAVDRLLVNELVPWPTRSSQGRRKLVSVSRSITARLMRGSTAREGFLHRAVDFSATARLVAGQTPDGDTALLTHRLAWDLFRPLVVAEIARSEQGADRSAIASRAPHDATVIAAVRALADHALILVTVPEGPVRLLSLRFRPSADRALTVHPDLLDLIGWENLGRPVGMFAVLTREAGAEARTLLPSLMLPTRRTTAELAPDGPASPLDLAGPGFLDAVPRWMAYGDSFPLSEHDSLALGDIDGLLATDK